MRSSRRQTVRIDVRPRPKSPGDPVAMPDTMTVFGQAAGIIDVLANDIDPAGGLLAVQHAAADNPNQVDVAIIDGRWLRISSRQGELLTQPAARALHGQQRLPVGHRGRGHGQPASDPRGQRAGDDDRSRAGARRDLGHGTGARQRHRAVGRSADPGHRLRARGRRASSRSTCPKGVQGRRRAGPRLPVATSATSRPTLKEQDQFEVRYIARSSTGETAPGRLIVIISPGRRPNTPPEPPTLEVACRFGRHGQAPAARQRDRSRRRPGHGHGHHVGSRLRSRGLLRRQLPGVPGLPARDGHRRVRVLRHRQPRCRGHRHRRASPSYPRATPSRRWPWPTS